MGGDLCDCILHAVRFCIDFLSKIFNLDIKKYFWIEKGKFDKGDWWMNMRRKLKVFENATKKTPSGYFLSNWLMWGLRFTYVAWNDEENDKDITQCAASCHPVTAH